MICLDFLYSLLKVSYTDIVELQNEYFDDDEDDYNMEDEGGGMVFILMARQYCKNLSLEHFVLFIIYIYITMG